MGQISRALPAYLEALNNHVPGFLFTLAIDKRLDVLFGSKEKAAKRHIAQILKTEGLGDWKPSVAEKLIRVCHVTAFLTGLLAHDGQKIFWMTDHDEICPNQERHLQALNVFQRVLGLYKRPDCAFALVGGAVPFEERNVATLDLLSAADLVAGAVDQTLSPPSAPQASDREEDVCLKQIIEWHALDGIGLKKMIMLMRPKGEYIESAVMELTLDQMPEDAAFVPIVI